MLLYLQRRSAHVKEGRASSEQHTKVTQPGRVVKKKGLLRRSRNSNSEVNPVKFAKCAVNIKDMLPHRQF